MEDIERRGPNERALEQLKSRIDLYFLLLDEFLLFINGELIMAGNFYDMAKKFSTLDSGDQALIAQAFVSD
jgi:hypothetical protein